MSGFQLLSAQSALGRDEGLQDGSAPLSLLEQGQAIWMGLTLKSSKNIGEFQKNVGGCELLLSW